MKRIFSALIFLTIALRLGATSASPKPIPFRQPDGTVVNVVMHGDEFCHWMTLDGREVTVGGDGFVHPSATKSPLARAAKAEKLRAQRDAAMTKSSTTGNERHLVILVEFKDERFIKGKTDFNNLLNESGYSDNKATGSVKDYFVENSSGKFIPTFDVVGPVTLSSGYATYGVNEDGDDKEPTKAFVEAVKLANSKNLVDFSKYDHNGDGVVDDIFFYFAGVNESESGDPDRIWPHSFSLLNKSLIFNGVRIGNYACASEFYGSDKSEMCGIGTFCHEFGHVLGLHDLYDIDYEEHGAAENTPGRFSLMDQGNYNNDGRTPPYLCFIERQMLGWAGNPQQLAAGNQTLQGLTDNYGYKIPTSTAGEYFILEVRPGTGWDAYISTDSYAAAGLVIYHIDQSNNVVYDQLTAKSLWNSSKINFYGAHPCCYLKSATPNSTRPSAQVWPGVNSKKKFSDVVDPYLVSWAGASTGFVLSDIAYSGGRLSMKVAIDNSKKIVGTVRNLNGEPVQGARITVAPKASGTKSGALSLTTDYFALKSSEGSLETTTDANGDYSLNIEGVSATEFSVIVSCSGYSTINDSFSLSSGGMRLDFTLKKESGTETATLKKYKEPSSYGLGMGDTPCDVTVAVKYTEQELRNLVGLTFKSITFRFCIERSTQKPEKVDVFVDFGNSRKLTKTVTSISDKFITVDVSSFGLKIPSGTDVCFGYAIKGSKYGYPIAVANEDAVTGGGFAVWSYLTEGTLLWSKLQTEERGYNVLVSAELKSDNFTPLDESLGVKYIKLPKAAGAFSEGDNLPLEYSGAGDKPSSVSWSLDGTAVAGNSVKLTRGAHTLTLTLNYSTGVKETISQEINVR